MDIVIRKAGHGDKDFIIKSIIEATKSGFDKVSYCTIFGITEAGLRTVLSNILEEDMDGQELCISSYLIAEINGVTVAAMGAWIEEANGMASKYITANLLMHYMDRELIIKAEPALKLIKETYIQRDAGTLQLEIAYLDSEALLALQREDTFTFGEFRKLDVIGKLITEHIKFALQSDKPPAKAQTIPYKNNAHSIRAHQKAGFAIIKEKKCEDSAILQLLPCDTKVMMEKELNL